MFRRAARTATCADRAVLSAVSFPSCIYVGAWLWYDDNGVMQYTSGRANRNSVWPDGSAAVDHMEETKLYFCNKGIAHWGNNALIQNSEFFDVRVSAMLFGEAAVVNGQTA